MTCEEFKKVEGNGLSKFTRAERASLVAHAIKCQSCSDWIDSMIAAFVVEAGVEKALGCIVRCVALSNEDLQDPEFREVVGR